MDGVSGGGKRSEANPTPTALACLCGTGRPACDLV